MKLNGFTYATDGALWEKVEVVARRYENGRIALHLASHDNGYPELLATVTVNLPHFPCGPDEVYVNSWSDNEGMLLWLAEQRIVEFPPTGFAETGHILAPRCRLTPQFLAAMWGTVDTPQS
jgi:hypothetical protein